MASLNSIFRLTDGYSKTVDKVMNKTDQASTKLMGASKSADNFNTRLNSIDNNASKASNGLGKLVGAVASLAAVQKTISLTDELTLTSARLDLMNDGLQTTTQLQDQIFQSAQRSRGVYTTTADAVAKLGVMAKDAFSSTSEIVAFSEQINKQFTIAGTSAAGVSAAMLQLTQAMASGVLRGEELNSIFEQAPTIIQSIADYMGVPIGQIRALAQEGKISASIVKNAMFAAADETNAKFASMPMTFSQSWTMIQNSLIKTFLPIIQNIAKGGQWIGDNWSNIEPIFYGLAAAATAYAIGLGIQAAATWIADGAAKTFFTTLMTNPLFWIALSIGLVIGMIYKWVQSVGGIKIAWMIATDKFLTGWDMIKIGFMTGVTSVQDFMGGLKTSFLSDMETMINGGIDLINDFINTVNKIPGVAFDTVDHVTFGTNSKLEYEANKIARANNLKNMKYDAGMNASTRQSEIDIARAVAASNVNSAGFDTNNPLIVEGTGNNNSVDVSMDDNDLQYIRDMAERDYINKFSTATLAPNIQFTFGDIHETADANKVRGVLEKLLSEEIAVVAEG